MRVTRIMFVGLSLALAICSLGWGEIIYVDDDAGLGGDGTSWETAYKFLQDGLNSAAAGVGEVEIRVAQGVYKPDRDSSTPEGSGGREVYFEVPEGVSLKGGYAGLVGVDPNKRDVELYETVLSGDLAEDDVDVNDPSELYDEPTRLDNSNHVVVAYQSTVIDGFVVTAGRALREGSGGGDSGPAAWNCGGGIYVIGDDVSISCCVIQGNMSRQGGGGVYVYKELTGICLSNCRILDNANYGNGYGGGGLCISSNQIDITDCEFVGNRSSSDGGGGLYYDSDVNISGCIFVNNEAERFGGALLTEEGLVLISDSTFYTNRSKRTGGAINCDNGDGWYYLDDRIEIIRSKFMGNASRFGGAIMNYGVFLSESTLYCGNIAEVHGGAIYSSQSTSCIIQNNSFVENNAVLGQFLAARYQQDNALLVKNCIVSNGDEEFYSDQAQTRIEYTAFGSCSSSIYDSNGIIWGQGNINIDPCFVDPGCWDNNGTPDDSYDDTFVMGDYHLKSQAGHWDVDSDAWIYDEVTSPCIDAGDPNSPIMYEPFPNGGRINMGAYGGTPEASRSYFGEPVCETIIAGDINGDGRVNFADLAILVSHWLE